MKTLSTHITESFVNESVDWSLQLGHSGLAEQAGYKGTGKYGMWDDKDDYQWDAVWADKEWPVNGSPATKDAFCMNDGGYIFTFDKAQGYDKFKKTIDKFAKSNKIKDLTDNGFVENED